VIDQSSLEQKLDGITERTSQTARGGRALKFSQGNGLRGVAREDKRGEVLGGKSARLGESWHFGFLANPRRY